VKEEPRVKGGDECRRTGLSHLVQLTAAGSQGGHRVVPGSVDLGDIFVSLFVFEINV